VFVLCDLRQREGGDFKFIEMEQQPAKSDDLLVGKLLLGRLEAPVETFTPF
jgi:hypothetical protein